MARATGGWRLPSAEGPRHEESRITTLTLLTGVVVLYGVLNARGFSRALALAGATPVGAAAILGAVAVPTFYAVALGAAAGVVLRFLHHLRSSPAGAIDRVPGIRPLVLLFVVAVLVTLLSPMIFDGLRVLASGGGDARLASGVLTKSNLAQIAYLLLSLCVVVYLARSPSAGPEIVGTAAILATLLSLWAWSGRYGVPYPTGVFDNSPAFIFIDTLAGGLPRVRGIFSEPAGLAGSCLITLAYSASRLGTVAGPRRLGLVVTIMIAVFLGSISTSATFFVAGAVLAVLALAVGASRFLLRRGPLSGAAVTVVCAAAIAALWVLPLISNFLGSVVEQKVGSSSYDDRSGADAYSYKLVVDTLGLGVGLGSNRASSFAASLLSTVGVVGTLLFVVAVAVLLRETWGIRAVRPVAWALMALLVTKVISGPDLADSSGILWLSLGVLARAALTKSATPASDTARA
jgi:hypothetical protein